MAMKGFEKSRSWAWVSAYCNYRYVISICLFWIHVCVCEYIYTYICMYTYIHVCRFKCIYTHTHIKKINSFLLYKRHYKWAWISNWWINKWKIAIHIRPSGYRCSIHIHLSSTWLHQYRPIFGLSGSDVHHMRVGLPYLIEAIKPCRYLTTILAPNLEI